MIYFRHIILLVALAILSVFVLATSWEFVIEDALTGSLVLFNPIEDAAEKWGDVMMATVFSTLGMIVPAFIMFRFRQTITHAYRQVSNAKEEAEQANHSKSDFLAAMSHELRTPLNSIIGYSQMVAEEVHGKITNDKYLEYVNDIQNSGYHLLHLINDILDLSKIEAKEVTLAEADVDLHELLESCLRMIKGRKEAGSLSIHYHGAADLPHIRADELLIKQIVLNLLSNAVKFNVAAGTVSLSANVDQNNALSIAVLDTGVGISAEDIPRVLEPFGQALSDAYKAQEGTGLGLSISRQLAELHGGALALESALGRGTTATVTFPPERTIGR